MHVRALCYILANGPEGLKEVSEMAVLNANYIRAQAEGRVCASLRLADAARSRVLRQESGAARRPRLEISESG